tara:strand:- start:31455 stop:32654 length:1200 start_codon:yes stop_codon:yes gene_type:complete
MMIRNDSASRRALAPKAVLTLCVVGLLVLAIVFLATSMQSTPQRARSTVSAPTTPSPAAAPPKKVDETSLAEAPVSITPGEFDFGLMAPGSVTRRTVQVRNTGAEPVQITGTKKTCSCTTVELEPGVLQPGQSMPVTAVMAGGLRPSDKSTVKVVLQYASHKPTTIGIVGKISLPVSTTPSTLRMHPRGYDDPAYSTKGVIQLKSEDGTPFRVLRVNGGEPEFMTPVLDSSAPSLQHQLRWRVEGFDPVTGLDEHGEPVPEFLVVETDRPDVPVVAVPLNHRLHRPQLPGQRPWFTIDKYAVVGGTDPGASAGFTLQLNGNTDPATAETVYLVESDSPAFDAGLVSSRPSVDGKGTDLEISVTPRSGVEGVYVGDIVLRSENWEQPFSVVGFVGEPGDS